MNKNKLSNIEYTGMGRDIDKEIKVEEYLIRGYLGKHFLSYYPHRTEKFVIKYNWLVDTIPNKKIVVKGFKTIDKLPNNKREIFNSMIKMLESYQLKMEKEYKNNLTD